MYLIIPSMYFRVNLKIKPTLCCCFTWIVFIDDDDDDDDDDELFLWYG